MIFAFGIEKEAEIYCASTKIAFSQQATEIESQIAEIAAELECSSTIDMPYDAILNEMVSWTEVAVKSSGWNLLDEDGVSWWIGIFTQSYIRAKHNDTPSFDKIFKSVFINYFKYR